MYSHLTVCDAQHRAAVGACPLLELSRALAVVGALDELVLDAAGVGGAEETFFLTSSICSTERATMNGSEQPFPILHLWFKRTVVHCHSFWRAL